MKIGTNRDINVEVSVRDNASVHVYIKAANGETQFTVSPLDAIRLSEHILMAADAAMSYLRRKQGN